MSNETVGHLADRPVSRNTYANYGCRCDGCRAAVREYKRGKPQAKRSRGQTLIQLLQPADTSWMVDAACRGVSVDVFFQEGRGIGLGGSSYMEARRICANCPVQQKCLEYGADWSLGFGYWGGLTPRQRRKLRRNVTTGKPVLT